MYLVNIYTCMYVSEYVIYKWTVLEAAFLLWWIASLK